MTEKTEHQAVLEMQKELKQTETGGHGACGDGNSQVLRQTEAGNHVNSNTSAASCHVSGKSDNLEDLFCTLQQQISTSDWLQKNTADQWVKENPELAKEYKAAAKDS